MSLLILTLLAAHQGEEFVIILPAVMLVGAFFILRWANQNDATETDAADADVPEESPVGAVPSAVGPDADETTR